MDVTPLPPSDDDLVVARPAGVPAQLMLLFHGVGAEPADLAALGRRLAAAFPQACVVCVRAPAASDFGRGFQWFSVRGIDEAARVERVAAAMPEFLARIRGWQQATGAGVEETALVGFSQGAIMALESTARAPRLAGRVIAIAGRFAALPAEANPEVTLHLFHGKADPVIPYAATVEAAEHLVALGGDLTADVLPFHGHAVDDEIADLLIERLRSHIPQRVWREAMRDAPG